MRLINKIAIITGGARGIGKAAVEIFCREGASVIIWDMLDSGEETAKEVRAIGGICEFMKVSTTDVPAVEEATTDFTDSF